MAAVLFSIITSHFVLLNAQNISTPSPTLCGQVLGVCNIETKGSYRNHCNSSYYIQESWIGSFDCGKTKSTQNYQHTTIETQNSCCLADQTPSPTAPTTPIPTNMPTTPAPTSLCGIPLDLCLNNGYTSYRYSCDGNTFKTEEWTGSSDCGQTTSGSFSYSFNSKIDDCCDTSSDNASSLSPSGNAGVTVVIVIVVLLIILIGGYLGYLYFKKKKQADTDLNYHNTLLEEEQKETEVSNPNDRL